MTRSQPTSMYDMSISRSTLREASTRSLSTYPIRWYFLRGASDFERKGAGRVQLHGSVPEVL